MYATVPAGNVTAFTFEAEFQEGESDIWPLKAPKSGEKSLGSTQREIQKNGTVYNFDTSDVDGKPEVAFKCLKRLVGERGFEPPTPWSRTRF